jgi:hypothetical protein
MALSPNPIEAGTVKHLQACLTLQWGDPVKTARYVRWETDLDTPLGIFVAAPELEIITGRQHGGMADVPATFVIDPRRAPMDKLLRPYEFATVYAAVGECDATRFGDTYREWFAGEVGKTVENKHGKKRLCEGTVMGHKGALAVPLGLPCLPTCANRLGDTMCAVDLGPYTHSALVASVEGFTVQVTPGMVYPSPGYYVWGEAKFDALSIMIVQDSAELLTLMRRPPPEWAGNDITVVAGCNKRHDDPNGCPKFNNLEHFMGLGVRMPAHNPQFESP